MPNSLMIIVHPHCGVNPLKMQFAEQKPGFLRRRQAWAREHPRAEEILSRYNVRDAIYREEALRARSKGVPAMMLDHDHYPRLLNDDICDLIFNPDMRLPRQMSARVAHEIYRMKTDLVMWFALTFGDRHVFSGDHKKISAHLRDNFPEFPADTRIRILGEFLGCCVDDVHSSLSDSGYVFSRVVKEKCVA